VRGAGAGAVTKRSTIALGLRLAVGGGRAALVRLLLMAGGVALGVGLLIGGLGIVPAIQARHLREIARTPVIGAEHRREDVLLWIPNGDRIGHRDLLRYTVAAIGRAPVPPGLDRAPGPDELFVSPALAEILPTATGRLVRPRLPGRLSGLIGQQGLLGPDELVAYVGVRPSAVEADDAPPAVSFGEDLSVKRPIPLGLKLLILMGVLGLLVPILVFVATSTRLSAASRERRLAAIRLVGGTPSQVRVLAAVESGLGAVLGSTLGLILFLALRPVVAGLRLGGYRWFSSDIAPPVGEAVAILVAAPLLAVGAALLSLRRVSVSPLGVTRRARVRRAGVIRLVPLAVGLGGLGLCWLARATVRDGGPGSLVAVGLSFVLVLVGLALVAPWLGSAAAPLITRGDRRLGALLGARRLQADPTAAGRVVAAMAILVFGAGLIHALVPAGVRAGADIAFSMRQTVVLVEGLSDVPSIRRTFQSLRGVRLVVPLSAISSNETASVGTGAPNGFGAWVADCAQLQQVLIERFPACRPDTAYVCCGRGGPRLRPGAVVPVVLDGSGQPRTARVRIPATVRVMDLGAGGWQLGTDLILPPDSLPAAARAHLQAYRTMVATDGTDSAVEHVRNAAARLDPSISVRTLDQARSGAEHDSRQMTSLVDLGILIALGIALANLLVVSVDHVQERRRPVAVLAATGVPLGVLRRSVAVEVALPLLPAILLAGGLSIAFAAVIASIDQSPLVVPVGSLVALSALAVGAVAVVTAFTLPALARAARPETLQAE